MKILKKIVGPLGLLFLLGGLFIYLALSEFNIAVSIALILGLVLVLAYGIMTFQDLKKVLVKRTTRYVTNAVIFAAAVVVILFILNYISFRHHKRFDLTSSKIFTLSDKSVKVVEGLGREVGMTCFFQENTPEKEKAEDLLSQYVYRSDSIKYEFVDPDKRPAIAKNYGVKQYGTIVLESGGQQHKITKTEEEDITNAMVRVTQDEKRVIYFVKGHGERDITEREKAGGYALAKEALEDENYEVKDVFLTQAERLPEDCTLLIVAGPLSPYLDAEKDMIGRYIEKGGRSIFMIDPDAFKDWEDFMKEWGIRLDKGIIVDEMGRLFAGDATIPIISNYEDHEIVKDFSFATFLPLVGPVKAQSPTPEGIEVSEVAKSSPNSWVETDIENPDPEGKEIGPIPVMAAFTVEVKEDEGDEKAEEEETKAKTERETEEGEGRAVVFGDSDFISNNYLNLSGNLNLFLNTVGWLAHAENLISIRTKSPGYRGIHLTGTQTREIFVLTVLLIPGLIVFVGTGIWWTRRKR